MSEQLRSESGTNVVQLNPERSTAGAPAIVLARLPAAMHSLRDKARQHLQGLLRDFFDKVDDAMFELADKASNNQDQNLYFDSMREVRLHRRAMETSFFRQIDIRFAQLLDPNAYRDEYTSAPKEFSIDELSLVQNDDLEEMVAIDGMVNKANETFAESIQHLTLRIDHLVPIKVYQKNNPLGVDVICNAFNQAAKSLDIDVKAKLVLFKLFDNLVMANLGGLYQTLNQLLIESNILPSLKQGRAVKRTVSAPVAENPYGAGISAGAHPVERGTATGVAAAGYDEQTNQLLLTLRNLLGSRGASGGAGEFAPYEEVTSQDLVKILSLAQHQNVQSYGVRDGAGHVNVRILLQDLLRNQNSKAQALNQIDEDVINLVSMMFDFILDDRNLAAPMKALIGRLQIPMVKVAIADKTFFSKGGHPARRLLNEMAMAAIGWQESAEENQRKDSLYNKMESLVQSILADFETDIDIFNSLLTDFRAFLDREKRRAQILEQRTLDAEDGKAKSERARMQVDLVLNRLVSGHDLPAPAQKLLREAWGNVLFITSLKQGAESSEWQAAIRTAQQLVWSLTAPMTKENRQGLLKLVPDLLSRLRAGLEGISYSPFETTQLFKQLESLHLARLRSGVKIEEPVVDEVQPIEEVETAQEEPTELSMESVAQPLMPDEEKVEVASSAELVEPLVPANVSLEVLETFVVVGDLPAVDTASDDLGDADPHLTLVGNITQGSWFEMQSDDGQKFRCRLAAIIRATGKYIFVNRSGVKVAEETRMTLAMALKSGRLQVLDDGMLFDRALEAVIGNLRASR